RARHFVRNRPAHVLRRRRPRRALRRADPTAARCHRAGLPVAPMTAEPVITPGGIVIPAGAMTWRFSRGTGPGGQGVNTTDSRVELVVDLAELVTSSEVADRVRGKLGDSLRIVATTERSQL